LVEHKVTTIEGRLVAVVEDGDPDGRAVLVHAGTPLSRLLYAPDVALAKRQGIRLISYDRPGYGSSAPRSGRSVGDCAEDVRTIAAALGVEQLGVWGISGGGPHALACAALLEGLVVAVASLASLAPYGAPGLDYFAGMGELNVEDIRMSLEDPVAARAKAELDREEYLAADATELTQSMRTLLTPTDAGAFTGEFGEHLAASIHQALAPGVEGWWDDGVALVTPWGFELDSITTPVLLHHGREDRFVPFGHGEWLAKQIPGVRAELTDDDGHLTLIPHHLEAIHEWLLEHFR
jgi:pimeloyl-ACP methyl ester carboxylesterase